MSATPAIERFQAARPRLQRLAYRMLGSVADAEDVLQDAWLRFSTGVPPEVRDDAAWLLRVVTHLCIDRLRQQRARREVYDGPWLPEPIVEQPDTPGERAEEVSIAFLLALERLSPLDRAAFLLHEVFDEDYATIAGSLGRSEAACRQIVARAREHVRGARRRYVLDEDKAQAITAAFLQAVGSGDAGALAELLTEDVVYVSDAGGKRRAARKPVLGRDRVTRFLNGIVRRGHAARVLSVSWARINGAPGVVVTDEKGIQTITLDLTSEGKISAIYFSMNPEKLRHLPRLTDPADRAP